MENPIDSIENVIDFDLEDDFKSKNNFEQFYILLKDFANIFNYKEYDKEFVRYLKSIEIPNTQVCSKIMKDCYHVECSKCNITSLSCICLDCYKETQDLHEIEPLK